MIFTYISGCPNDDKNSSLLVTIEDIKNWESKYRRLPNDGVLLFNTGL